MGVTNHLVTGMILQLTTYLSRHMASYFKGKTVALGIVMISTGDFWVPTMVRWPWDHSPLTNLCWVFFRWLFLISTIVNHRFIPSIWDLENTFCFPTILSESTEIGYRYANDGGHIWKEIHFPRPIFWVSILNFRTSRWWNTQGTRTMDSITVGVTKPFVLLACRSAPPKQVVFQSSQNKGHLGSGIIPRDPGSPCQRIIGVSNHLSIVFRYI